MDVDDAQAGSAAVTVSSDLPFAAVKPEQQEQGEPAVGVAAAAQNPPNGKTQHSDASDAAGTNGAPMVNTGNDAEEGDPDHETGQEEGAEDDLSLGISRSNSSGGGGGGARRERLPLDPTTLHPAFAGRRPLSKHESPASGRAYGLWDPTAVHPVYFGHLRQDGEAAGAAGLSGWTGAGDGGAIDRALRVLRGAADAEAAAAAAAEGNAEGKGKEVAGVVRWSAQERATVLGLLCEEASATGVALDHMKVRERFVGVRRPRRRCGA